MTGDSKSPKKRGQFSEESFLFKEITWRIPKEIITSNKSDHGVEGPTFSFAGATWNLHIYPHGGKAEDSEGWIQIEIDRLKSNVPQHNVFYKIFFETVRGKVCNALCQLLNFDTEFDRGYVLYMHKDTFSCMKKALIVNGIVTLRCQMRSQKINAIKNSSQTESAVTFADCDCATWHPASFNVTKMLQDFKELYLKQEDCDVTIIVKDQKFPAHKNILKARSSVFASTFRTDMEEKATGIVNIEDCDPASFPDFLCFLYCGSIENLSTENVFSLFTTADKYNVQDLRSECLKFIKKSISVYTFCDTVALALQHCEKQLIELTSNFFMKNLDEIIVTTKWQSFLVENPIQCNELFIKALASKKN